MNAKQLKFLSTFEQMCAADPLTETAAKKFFPAFLNIESAMDADVWDYLAKTYENNIAAIRDLGAFFGDNVLDLFYKKAASRVVKIFADAPAVRRVVYQYAPLAADGTAFGILVDLLAGNKTDAADEILKCLVKNERIAYGAFLKAVLERLFIEILKKNPAKKIEMPRKTATLLLTYIAKIKTDERAMLEQRIRETL